MLLTAIEAVEYLDDLVDGSRVWINDGVQDWDIEILLEYLRVGGDETLLDVAVTEAGISKITDDGYADNHPLYRVVPRKVDQS